MTTKPDAEPKFGPLEIRMVERILEFLAKTRTCSPKMHQVVQYDPENDPKGWRRQGFADRKAFANLVAMGYVTHRCNGYCWVTDEGKRALVSSFERLPPKKRELQPSSVCP